MQRLHVAVFVDAENIGARHWPEIRAAAEALGPVNSSQIFGDFTEDRLGKWLDIARTHGLQAVLQLSGGKNATDIAITIAAMDIMHGGRVQAIVLASSDQDYAPLALRLRTGGIKVCGCGLPNTPESLRVACTGFTVLGTTGTKATASAA